jgi:hypothetical protein
MGCHNREYSQSVEREYRNTTKPEGEDGVAANIS